MPVDRTSQRPHTLIERSAELDSLRAAFLAARDERGGVIVVEGEGGIGKTSLLRVLGRATAPHATVLHASGRDLERDLPYGVVRQLVEPAYRAAGPARRAELLSGHAALLEPILGAQAGPEPAALHHGLLWFLLSLSTDRPAVLLVDDAHLADPGSLDGLIYVAARMHEMRALLVVAYRPPATAAHADRLRALRRVPGARRLLPQPLTEAGVTAVLNDAGLTNADPAFVAACTQASGGVPLFVHELAHVARETDLGSAGPEAAQRVLEVGPEAVAEAVALTLSHHPRGATAFVRALAVLGDATLDEVARLAELELTEAATIAAALTREGLLTDRHPVGFSHPIVRQSVRDGMVAAELALAHALAAALRFDAGADDAVVAAHLIEAPAVGKAWASGALTRAAASAAGLGQHESAARLLRRALAEPGDRAATLAALAAAEAALGDAAAGDTYTRAIELSEDPLARAELHLMRGRTLLAQARFREAAETFGAGVREAEGRDERLATELRASRAGAALWDPSGGAEALAAEIASIQTPSTAAERIALANLAGGLMLSGGSDHRTALELSVRAWGAGELLRTLGPADPTLWAVTAVVTAADAVDEAGRYYRAIRDEARRRGLPVVAATGSYGVALNHLHRGALAEALAEASVAFDAEVIGWGLYAAATHFVRTAALVGRGEVAQAATLLAAIDPEREARLRAGSDGSGLDAAIGLVALAQGRADDALSALRAAEAAMRPVGNLPGPIDWRPLLVRALIAAGRDAEAWELAEEYLGQAERWGAPFALGIAQRHRALVEADGPARRDRLVAAADLLAAAPGAPLERVATLVDLATAHLAAEDPVAARTPAREALDLAETAGAVPLATRARDLLVQAGGRPRRTRTRGVDALTAGELQVVRLAAEGRTNREIAELLFVTPKAVRWHLSNAYRKLEVSDRAELAGALGDTVDAG